MIDVDTSSRESEDTFKILLATDIHLGYNEKDPIRGNDSFESFEEVLQLAQEHQVDFILLGGDLFDANKPTQYTLQRAVDLIKKYTFGDKDINFRVYTDFDKAELHNTTTEIMKEAIPDLNFCDPNLNVAIPVFSIHGNHDDPTGMKSISSLDTLATMGLVNYFGRCDKLDAMDIRPLLLLKGETELALYGVGHLADKRFVRLHRDGKVVFHQVNVDSAFQMLILHQNRANRGTLNFLPYTVIPNFMDLVMWGHEHDCYIEPTMTNDVFYSQPGSTVATSLSEGESIPKKVGILYVNKKNFYIEPIELKHVRPLKYRHVLMDSVEELSDMNVAETELGEYTEKHVIGVINEMLEEVEKTKENNIERLGYKNEMLPLIRVVVQYYDERQSFNDKKLALVYDGQVANPQEIVLQKLITAGRYGKRAGGEHTLGDDDLEETDNKDVMSFVQRELEQDFPNPQLLTSSGTLEALKRYVNCGDVHAFDDYVEYRKNKFSKELLSEITSDASDEEIERKIDEKLSSYVNIDEAKIVEKLLNNPGRAKTTRNNDFAIDDDIQVVDVPAAAVPAKPARGRGARGAKAPKARGRGRGARAAAAAAAD